VTIIDLDTILNVFSVAKNLLGIVTAFPGISKRAPENVNLLNSLVQVLVAQESRFS